MCRKTPALTKNRLSRDPPVPKEPSTKMRSEILTILKKGPEMSLPVKSSDISFF